MTLTEIRDDFAFLDDWEDRYRYVIELGRSLPPLAPELRIESNKVRAYPDPSSENTILVMIEYRVRSTNSLLNLVYPFYMRREQDL